MLNKALVSVGVNNVNVVAILNDTTGTLVAGSHDYSNCAIGCSSEVGHNKSNHHFKGLILGTGSNAAYIEDASRVLRWGDGDDSCHQGNVLMDPEMGAFGDNGCIDFIKTEWDKRLDHQSLLPGSFTFEKYFAGKYMGELTRLAFLSVLDKLDEDVPQNLNLKDSITTSDVSQIVQFSTQPDSDKPNVFSNLSDNHCAVLQYIAEVIYPIDPFCPCYQIFVC